MKDLLVEDSEVESDSDGQSSKYQDELESLNSIVLDKTIFKDTGKYTISELKSHIETLTNIFKVSN